MASSKMKKAADRTLAASDALVGAVNDLGRLAQRVPENLELGTPATIAGHFTEQGYPQSALTERVADAHHRIDVATVELSVALRELATAIHDSEHARS